MRQSVTDGTPCAAGSLTCQFPPKRLPEAHCLQIGQTRYFLVAVLSVLTGVHRLLVFLDCEDSFQPQQPQQRPKASDDSLIRVRDKALEKL